MTIKTGKIVSHLGGPEWGVGKVLEVTAAMATIHFSDGKKRKIAASHYSSLLPAAEGDFIPPAEPAQVAPALCPSKPARKKK